MNRIVYIVFTVIFLFQTSNFSYGQNCSANSASQFEACAAGQSSGTISVSNNSNFTVTNVVDVKNISITLGNNDITLHSDSKIDLGTSLSGGGSSSLMVDNLIFTKNTSPTYSELNSMLFSGNYLTLGEAAAAAAGVLPVTLTFFKADLFNKGVLLRWETASEINNEGFDILQSNNGVDWQMIGAMAGNGTSQEAIQYSFFDENPTEGNNYYRLKQLDYDGNFEYSPVISVFLGNEVNSVDLFPNPSNGVINLKTRDEESIKGLKVWNGVGQLVYQANEFSSTIDISTLSKGLYLVEVQSDRKASIQKIFFK